MLKLKTQTLQILLLPLQLLLIFFIATTANAQTFGGNPPSIKWEQINTPAARVIFPRGMDSTAKQVATLINLMNDAIKPTIGTQQRQISIVLQNQTTETNGYVGLAPFRSEFYLTPQQNSLELGSLPWAGTLAIHEFRHVQQDNNFNVGISKLLRTLFGQGGQALGNTLSVPNWFYEGDAVYNETLVSRQGRGRLPYFYNDFRALWQAGKNYSWMKLRNGSYQDLVPNHYPLGYMMVAYGRQTYGDDFWLKVTQDAAAYKSLFYPFQHAVKKYSGKDYTTFRNEALGHFKAEFNDAALKSDTKQPKHFVANNEYPAFINDSTLVYISTTYNKRTAFTILSNNGKAKTLRVRDMAIDNYFDYHNGHIAYASYRPALRWGYRDYSEINVLDLKTGKQNRISTSSKYFSPALSDSANMVVAVEYKTSGKSHLHILNAADGTLIKELLNPQNLYYTYPKFYTNNKVISAVRYPDGKMGLLQTDIITGEATQLLNTGMVPIAFLNVQGDKIYYTAANSTNDDVFAFDIKTRQLSVLDVSAEDGIGRYQPAMGNHKFAYVTLFASGYDIKLKKNTSLNWKPVNENQLSIFGISNLTTNSSAGLINRKYDTAFNYKPVKYNKGYRLFNFHSLIPDISDPNYTVALTGENVLNTFQSELSFNYNRNEGYKQLGFDATYGALFPYISAGINYVFDRRRLLQSGSRAYFNEFNIHGGLQVPLNFSSGRYIRGLSFGSDVYYTKDTYNAPNTRLNRNFTYLNNYLSFSNHIQQARQNIYPRFGQSLSFIYKSALSVKASQYLASGSFYLPGLSVNHSLIISAAHQQQGKDNLIGFSNNFPYSRGYTAENIYKMDKLGANYHFPIAYPDAGVANTVYFQRVRGNVYYEYTHVADQLKHTADFRSVGGTLFLDTKFFNYQSLTFGFRYSYLLDDDIFGGSGHNRFEIVLPVTFF